MMTRPMTENQILKAKHAAGAAHEYMTAAYWAVDSRAYLCDSGLEQLRNLAAAFGFDLVERADPLVETIPHAMQRVGLSPDDPRN